MKEPCIPENNTGMLMEFTKEYHVQQYRVMVFTEEYYVQQYREEKGEYEKQLAARCLISASIRELFRDFYRFTEKHSGLCGEEKNTQIADLHLDQLKQGAPRSWHFLVKKVRSSVLFYRKQKEAKETGTEMYQEKVEEQKIRG